MAVLLAGRELKQDGEKASHEIKRAYEEVKRQAGPKPNKATHESGLEKAEEWREGCAAQGTA
jgi:hypothetical protein